MPSPGYVQQVLWEAVKALDNEQRLAKLRIVDAGQPLLKLRPGDFDDPDHLARWSAILDTLLGAERDYPDGPIADTVRRMSEDQCVAVEAQIRELRQLVRPMRGED